MVQQQPPQQAAPQPQQPAVPAAQQGQDPRQSQMAIRYNTNDFERQWNAERQESGWGHARPFSIFIAAMGNHWAPGSWAAVLNAVQFANENGMYCTLEEIQDRCTRPYDAIGTMRNEGQLRAQYGGYEFLLYIDNDVLPEKEAIYRLARAMYEDQRSIMIPYVSEPGTGRPLHGPVRAKYQGLKPVRWGVLSWLMFRTSVFMPFPGGFWDDAIGADEGLHFQKLYAFGHMPTIQTEVVIPVAQAPTYPLTIEKQDNAEVEWKAKQEQFKAIPDRRPADPNDPRVSPEGVYMPFLPVTCPPHHGGCGQQKPSGPEPYWFKNPPYICGECQQRIGSQRAQAQQPQPEAPTEPEATQQPEAPQTLQQGPMPAPTLPPVGTVPRQPQKGEDGYYQRCAALNAGGEQCNNKTARANGFCHVHQDRAT